MTIFGALGTLGKGLATGVKNVGSGLKISASNINEGLSKVPSQYQFDNLSTIGNSTTPTQYQFDNLDKPLFGDYDLGGKNAGKNTLKTKTDSVAKNDFAKSLLGGSSSYTPQTSEYQFTPSMVDYSQFMGLSPETQRYLYGGM